MTRNNSEPMTYDTDNGHFERIKGELVWIPKSRTPILDSLTKQSTPSKRKPRDKGLTELLGGV